MKRRMPFVKGRALLLGCCALLAFQAAPGRELETGDFAWHATLATEHGEGLHQLQLSRDAIFAATAPGLHDLRIFNANGEALPVAVLPHVAPVADEYGGPVALRMAPLPGSPQAQDRALADYALRLERDRDRTVIEISPDRPAPVAKQKPPGGYLLDARPLKDMRGELSLHFAADAPDYADTATIFGSEDLVSWRPLANGPLARNRQLGDSVIERSSFWLDHPPAFLRVTWSAAAAPMLNGANFRERLAAPVAPPPGAALELAAMEDGRWLIDVPPGLALTKLAIHVAQPNQALRIELQCPQPGSSRSERRLHLRELAQRKSPQLWYRCVPPIEAFRIERSGQWIENQPVAVPPHPEQLLLQVVDPKDYRGPAPTVEAEWAPVRVAFLARAPGPYQLAVGHERAGDGPGLDLAGMLPRDDPGGSHLPLARVAQASAPDSGQAAARASQTVRNAARWRASLWAVLLLAVAVLAALALRLASSMRGAGR